MRGNGLGFSDGKPVAPKPTRDPPIKSAREQDEDCLSSVEIAPVNPIALSRTVEQIDLPICKSIADMVCCCLLTTFLVAAGAGIGIWYAIARPNV